MITVARSFEAPIKLVFPQDLLENGPWAANNFAMLGLGDIVIPGIFIALLLRFDLSRDPTPAGSKVSRRRSLVDFGVMEEKMSQLMMVFW